MDFSYTKQEKVIKETARKLLTKKCPSDLVRKLEQDEKGYSHELWKDMAGLGWMGFILPGEYEGFEGSFFEFTLLLEEIGRFAVPSPLLPTVILGGLPILYAGSEKQKQEFLPKIATGDLILTMALTELNPAYDASGVQLPAVRKGNGYVLDGIKFFVPYAQVADHIICAARTDATVREGGITLFLIKADNPGIRCTVLRTLDCEKHCEVVFDHVEVRKEDTLGEYNEGWKYVRKVLQYAQVGQCALMVGGAERVLEMTVEHALVREQFGRPIGAFQAVQHRCANMKVDLEASRLATYEAAWKIDQGLDAAMEVSVAKAWLNVSYNRLCDNGHQVHGGDGLMKEQDIQLFSKRAKGAEVLFGDSRFHREIIAEQLGL
ncbi:MAG: acyl-CoA dehydrogenase family protein [Syntrophorhabdales bacterium]|jgi:alkylation response protein AidB-like acyl-CoA dehydrogenase